MDKIYGLLGRHLGHSYSSLIHREFGCGEYRHIECEPQELEQLLTAGNFGGLNVTIPYKKNVMPFCDELSDAAEKIGCVNTIVPHNGKLVGHNTDADGFVFTARRAGIDFCGKKVVVFGSGGAHLAVKYSAKSLGASEIVTISRTGENNYSNLARHYDADILVNATPVGMFPEPVGRITDLSLFSHACGVIDLIYNPRRTNLLLQAAQLGIPCANGLSMLVAQAKRAEEFFFGTAIADSEIRRIMRIIAQKTSNLVLIGMPGSGKSTLGKLLAEISGKEVYDTDSEVERSAGMSISEIFSLGGEELFRRFEREAIAKVDGMSGKIIVTGGGAVKTDENYYPLRRTGRMYHIERRTELLPRENRPLSADTDLAEMFRQRLPLYERFRDTAIQNDGDAAEVAERIWRDFCENSCD